jgi:hypothetical protein
MPPMTTVIRTFSSSVATRTMPVPSVVVPCEPLASWRLVLVDERHTAEADLRAESISEHSCGSSGPGARSGSQGDVDFADLRGCTSIRCTRRGPVHVSRTRPCVRRVAPPVCEVVADSQLLTAHIELCARTVPTIRIRKARLGVESCPAATTYAPRAQRLALRPGSSVVISARMKGDPLILDAIIAFR